MREGLVSSEDRFSKAKQLLYSMGSTYIDVYFYRTKGY